MLISYSHRVQVSVQVMVFKLVPILLVTLVLRWWEDGFCYLYILLILLLLMLLLSPAREILGCAILYIFWVRGLVPS